MTVESSRTGKADEVESSCSWRRGWPDVQGGLVSPSGSLECVLGALGSHGRTGSHGEQDESKGASEGRSSGRFPARPWPPPPPSLFLPQGAQLQKELGRRLPSCGCSATSPQGFAQTLISPTPQSHQREDFFSKLILSNQTKFPGGESGTFYLCPLP